jgi:hypothetical protein
VGTFSWLGGSGSLDDANHWQQDANPPVVPGSGDSVGFLTTGGGLSGSISVFEVTFSSSDPETYFLDGSIASSFTLNVEANVSLAVEAGGSLSASLVGVLGGTVTVEGGSVTQNAPSRSLDVDQGGNFDLTSGTVSVTGYELVGQTDVASFTQSGGTNTTYGIELSPHGQFELDGGQYTVGAGNEYILGAAQFTLKGGSDTVDNGGSLIMGFGAGTGKFKMQGGSLDSANEYIGEEGEAEFDQSGGTNTAAVAVVIGVAFPDPSSGTYVLGTDGDPNGTSVLDADTIYVGSDPGCTGIFDFNTTAGDAAQLNVSYLIVGGQGTGTFTQGDGTVGALDTELQIGRRTGSDGTYNLDGGTVETTLGANEVVGDKGKGTFNQTAGDNRVDGELIVGNDNSGATDTYMLSGDSTVTVDTNVQVGALSGAVGTFDFDTDNDPQALLQVQALLSDANAPASMTVGVAGTGTFTQEGGTVNLLTSKSAVPFLDLALQTGSTGEYDLHAGELEADTGPAGGTMGPVIVGDQGTGTFIQDGGHAAFGGDLIVGNADKGVGTYTLSGADTVHLHVFGNVTLGAQQGSRGTFNFDSDGSKAQLILEQSGKLTVGDAGIGIFKQGGGTLTATAIVVGNNNTTDTNKETELDVAGSSTLTVTNNLQIGVKAGAVGTVNFDNDDTPDAQLTINAVDGASDLVVGVAGTGTFSAVAGTIALSNTTGAAAALVLGSQQGSNGSFYMGGKLTTSGTPASNADVIVGDQGKGTFKQSDGQATFGGNLIVGNQSTGVGSYELIGDSSVTLQVALNVTVGAQQGATGTFNYNDDPHAGAAQFTLGAASIVTIGDAGTGTFTQGGDGGTGIVANNGGTLQAAALLIGNQAIVLGTYNLGGGTLISTGQVTVGWLATGNQQQTGGTITQTGGEANFQAALFIGAQGGATGTYNLSNAASLTVAAATVVGDDGTGTFTQSGGTANFNGRLLLGESSHGFGTYNFSKGELTVAGQTVVGDADGANFSQTGGTAKLKGGLSIGARFGSNGSYNISVGTLAVTGNTVVGDRGLANLVQSGGTATFSANVIIGNDANSNGTYSERGAAGTDAVIGAEVDIGSGQNSKGEFDFNEGGGQATLEGANANGPIFKVGIGGKGTLFQGGGTLQVSDLAVGAGNIAGSTGNVTVNGAQTVLRANTMEIGNSSSTNVSGGIGTLIATNGARVSVDGQLHLLDVANIVANAAPATTGRIGIANGGGIEVGGHANKVAANTLQIDAGGRLFGHGLVDAATINDNGLLEAQDGALIATGKVLGNGQAQIDANATLELGAQFGRSSVTIANKQVVKFNDPNPLQGTGTLILDDLDLFNGKITGLAVGDKIILKNTNLANGTAVVDATVGNVLDKPTNALSTTLEIREGTDADHLTDIVDVPIDGAAGAPPLTGDPQHSADYFQVTKSGNDTVLTLMSGNPINLAMNGQPFGSGLNGSGIKIGVISDSFNQLTGLRNINNGALPNSVTILSDNTDPNVQPGEEGRSDEGRAMAQIIHRIAPGAAIEFATAYGGDPTAVMAADVNALRAAGCQIIVDDIYIFRESNTGGALNAAINAAVQAGVTYIYYICRKQSCGQRTDKRSRGQPERHYGRGRQLARDPCHVAGRRISSGRHGAVFVGGSSGIRGGAGHQQAELHGAGRWTDHPAVERWQWSLSVFRYLGGGPCCCGRRRADDAGEPPASA